MTAGMETTCGPTVLVLLVVSTLLVFPKTAECDHPAGCGQRDEYYFLRHVCKLACVTTEDCRAAEQCVCDGRCGPSCVDISETLSCPLPISVPGSGMVWLSPPPGSVEPGGFGTTAHFSCNAGYQLIGHEESTCTSTGHWSEDSPHCIMPDVAADCAEPAGLENGVVVVAQNRSEARYDCQQGYTISGRYPIIRCVPGVGWEPLQIECVRMKCSGPGSPNNGFITSLDFRYGSTVSFRCLPSFILNGAVNLTCLSNGSWDKDVPTCEAVRCASPVFPAGTVSLSDDELLIGTQVTFQCAAGYELNGPELAECLEDLTWSMAPPDCQVTTCHRPDIHTSGISITTPRYVFGYGEIITYRCLRWREKLHGDQTRQCGQGGRWTGREPSCHEICPALRHRVNGGEWVNLPSDAKYMYNWNGGTRVYFCSEFHRMVGTSTFLCQNGEWSSSDFPRCQEDRSSDGQAYPIRSLTHSIVNNVLAVKQREALVTLDCRLNASLGGPVWEKDGQSPSGQQGVLQEQQTTHYWYRLSLYNVAQSDAGLYNCTSTEQEQRSSTVRIEVVTTCPDPGYQEGRQTNRDTTGGVAAGRRGFVKFTCDEGYDMIGDNDQIGCNIDGNWNYDPPDCVKPNCLDSFRDDPENGFSERAMLGDDMATQTFFCPVGYSMLQSGTAVLAEHLTVTCQNGVWDGAVPSCVQRGDMMSITTNARMVHRDINAYAGNEVEINCTYAGPQPPPQWSMFVDDNNLDLASEQVPGGIVLRFPAISIDDAGVYTCSNLDMSYAETIKLNVIASCPDPPIIPHVTTAQPTSPTAYYVDDVVTFECAEDFVLHGHSHIRCTDGGWNATFPECIAGVDLAIYKDGRHLPSGSIVLSMMGSTVFLDCAYNVSKHDASVDGFIGWWRIAPNGEKLSMATHHCQLSYGDWHLLRLAFSDLTPDFSSPYVCGTVAQEGLICTLFVTIPCTTPAPLVNGNVQLSNGTSYLSIASYECLELYALSGTPQRQCQANGDWSGEVPTCTLAYCPSQHLPVGTITSPDVIGQLIPIDTTVSVGCEEGMILSGSMEIVCRPNATLYMEQGPPTCTDPCLDYDCPLGRRCGLIGDGPGCASCLDEADCPLTADDNGPVCGTDAHDYPNACLLGVTACKSNKLSLEKAFDGRCIQRSLCYARPTPMGRGSPLCPHPEKVFYYNSDPKVVRCTAVKGDECMLEGGFESMAQCEGQCQRNFCYDPPGEVGPCDQNQTYWTYDSTTGNCQPFLYGGCSGTRGNQNRFETLNDCIRSCSLGEVCQPCPYTMTLSNACFYGTHAMIIKVTKAERFVRFDYIRLTVDVEAVLTQDPSSGPTLVRGPDQFIYVEGINHHLDSPCDLCPRLVALTDQPYLFMSSTYRGNHLKLDQHSYVAEWTSELEEVMQATAPCAAWVQNLNSIQD